MKKKEHTFSLEASLFGPVRALLPLPPGQPAIQGMRSGGPNLPFCYLCNRQFGTSSLAIHLKACKERWEREHGRPAPEPAQDIPNARPGSREWADFNDAAIAKFNAETLQPCPHCQRTFLPDRLAVHLRSCGQGHFAEPKVRADGAATPAEAKLGLSARQRRDESPKPFKPPSPASTARDDGASSARSGRETWRMKGGPPQLPACYLCGRQFGTSSLAIHLKACKERWEREHGRPAPEPSAEMPTDAPVGSKAWAAFNTAAIAKFNAETLQPCPHCQRTFLPDRLAVHLRTCGRGHFAEPKARPPST